MERKFTFVGISQSDLVDTLFYAPQTLFTYTQFWLLIHLSFPARQTVVIYHCILEHGEEPGSEGFQSLSIYIHQTRSLEQHD